MQEIVNKNDIIVITDHRRSSRRYTFFYLNKVLFFAEADTVNDGYKCNICNVINIADENRYKIDPVMEFQNNGNNDIDDYLRDCIYKFYLFKKPNDKLKNGYIFTYNLNDKKEPKLLERTVKLLTYSVNDCTFIDENKEIQHAGRIWGYKKLFELGGRNCIIDDDYDSGLKLFKEYINKKFKEEEVEKEKHIFSYNIYKKLNLKLNNDENKVN